MKTNAPARPGPWPSFSSRRDVAGLAGRGGSRVAPMPMLLASARRERPYPPGTAASRDLPVTGTTSDFRQGPCRDDPELRAATGLRRLETHGAARAVAVGR